MQSQWESTRTTLLESFGTYRFNTGLEKETFSFIRAINKYADNRTPWKLAKSEETEDRKYSRHKFGTMLEALRLASVAIAPIMPGIHSRIHEKLGVSDEVDWKKGLNWGNSLEQKMVGEKTILFPRD